MRGVRNSFVDSDTQNGLTALCPNPPFLFPYFINLFCLISRRIKLD